MPALECAGLSAWYAAHPEIRRLEAIRDGEGLRVLVELEPAIDSDEIHPSWLANHDVWIDELEVLTREPVRLESLDESLAGAAGREARDLVAALCWRDPFFFP
jgi:hypothetical protein